MREMNGKYVGNRPIKLRNLSLPFIYLSRYVANYENSKRITILIFQKQYKKKIFLEGPPVRNRKEKDKRKTKIRISSLALQFSVKPAMFHKIYDLTILFFKVFFENFTFLETMK